MIGSNTCSMNPGVGLGVADVGAGVEIGVGTVVGVGIDVGVGLNIVV